MVGLPIGNLKDITLRAIEVLRKVKYVVCEDTRSFKKLISHYELGSKRLFSFYRGVEGERVEKILEFIFKGEDVALVSEAGTPLVSDPGAVLVRLAHERGIQIIPVPGPSALSAAISVAGFSPRAGFLFLGFLPRKEKEAEELIKLAPPASGIVLFESPKRVQKTAKLLLRILGNRPCLLARELTKIHEEVSLTTLSELSERSELKGEVTLVIAPEESIFQEAQKKREKLSLPELLKMLKQRGEELVSKGLSKKEAARLLAEELGLKTGEVYETLLLLFKTEESQG